MTVRERQVGSHLNMLDSRVPDASPRVKRASANTDVSRTPSGSAAALWLAWRWHRPLHAEQEETEIEEAFLLISLRQAAMLAAAWQ